MHYKIEDFSPMIVIPTFAIALIESRLVKEFYDPNYKHTIFDLVEMVSDELAEKNYELFARPYFDKFCSVDELTLGDKDNVK